MMAITGGGEDAVPVEIEEVESADWVGNARKPDVLGKLDQLLKKPGSNLFRRRHPDMCNLYSVTKGQQAIRELYRAMVDRAGNMPPLPAIFPDQMAPVVRSCAEGRELAMMRWGFPCPPSVPGNRAVTNVRNMASSYWRAWMKPENRCLVPATSFCEYAPGKPAVPHWFALGEDRPLFAFAGLWRPWTGTRGTKAEPVDGAHELFAFLTCEPNAIVAPIHP